MMSSSVSGQINGKNTGQGTTGGAGTIVGVSGALSFMGCVREASPSPHDHHHHTLVMDDFNVERTHNTFVKEPKKRRFHPLRGLRRIFRKKSRNAADSRMTIDMSEHDSEPTTSNREELTARHPAGRSEEIRSKSASELLTDSCDQQSIFLRRHGSDEPFPKLRGASGQLSVSHDSIFSGEIPYIRPLSSLDALTTFERRQENVGDKSTEGNDNRNGLYDDWIPLGVLEQTKPATENRHDPTKRASIENNHVSYTSEECYQPDTENYLNRGCKQRTMKETMNEAENEDEEQRWRTLHRDDIREMTRLSMVNLPDLKGPSLSHTAAHHRISVRPKNRRPPRRTTSTITNIINDMHISTIATISASADTLDSLELVSSNNNAQREMAPLQSRSVPMIRKSSIRLSRTSDIFNELETKLPKISTSIASLSPDSLDMSVTKMMVDNFEVEDDREMECVIHESSDCISNTSKDELELLKMKIRRKSSIFNKYTKSQDNIVNSFTNSESFNKSIENTDVIPTFERLSNYISKPTDVFDKHTEQLEVKPIPKMLVSKSTEASDKFENSLVSVTMEEHNYFNQLDTINHTVSKFNSLQTANALLISDDSIEHKRTGFGFPSKRNIKVMSMSSENLDALEKSQQLKKRGSVTDIHLTDSPRHSRLINKLISKSTDSFDTFATNLNKNKYIDTSSMDKHYWKVSHRAMSSVSSDNLGVKNQEENCNIHKLPKKKDSFDMIDILCENSNYVDGKRQLSTMKNPPQFQKSSESSELGSTDTLDSYKRNKLFESTDTIDSLEKDLDNGGKSELYHEDDSESVATSKGETNVSVTHDVDYDNNSDNVEHTTALMPTDKYYWRQKSDSKENIDIHQLLAITLVSRMKDNSSNQRNSVSFPKKNLASSPTSSIVKQGGNKILLNNLLVNKNNEELQNMLNGNISEVSTDTKSFKEKLIMFEKLGK